MRRVKLVVAGKLKEPAMRELAAEYEKRLKRYCRLEVIEVADFPDGRDALEREAALILPHLSGEVYPLCIEGREYSSEELSALIEDNSHMTFVIGGSQGLSPEIKRSGKGLSFSKMTFPHQLMRIILLEQIYRSFKIISGEKYHK